MEVKCTLVHIKVLRKRRWRRRRKKERKKGGFKKPLIGLLKLYLFSSSFLLLQMETKTHHTHFLSLWFPRWTGLLLWTATVSPLNSLRTICIPSHSCLEANSFTTLKQTSLQRSPAKLYCEWAVFRRPSRGYRAVTKGYSQKDASLQVRLFLSSHLMSLPAILQSLVQHGKLNSLQNHNTCHHHFYGFTSHTVSHTSLAQNQLLTTYQLVSN